MGKAYAKELSALADTLRWASSVDIKPLETFVAETIGRPLIAVASGGSTAAAHLAALVHRERMGAFARHSTPLELLLSEPSLHQASVLLLSASGKNKDVLGALERSVACDARAVASLTMQPDSPLAKLTRAFERGYACDLESPAGKDGFLATNSLIATCAVIVRAYQGSLHPEICLGSGAKLSSKHVRSFVQVLHGGWGAPVATDLESRINESAVAAAQISDYRNFGHGRHLWLARRAPETIVVAVVTPETAGLAERTCALIPRDIPIVELRTELSGAQGSLELIAQSIHFVGALAELQSVDPGKPSVPEFGRKLYHLSPPSKASSLAAPVQRKLSRALHSGSATEANAKKALVRFASDLRGMRLGGIVLDYDGTLCTRAERFDPLRSAIAKECNRLLDGGLTLGLATGRGRSVRESLQKSFTKKHWDQVLIGYYNGGEIGRLADDSVPDRDASPGGLLATAFDLLKGDDVLLELAALTPRGGQITVEPKSHVSTDALLAHVITTLAILEPHGVRVLASSHSVDVLAPGVGKLAVVDQVKQRIASDTEVLTIGDRGMWPGNDFSLLAHKPSLSVDEVSDSFATCWNLAPYGVGGTDALLLYLRAITARRGIGSFASDNIWSAR
jgi:hypothetical protein